MRERRLVGMEALARWSSPLLGRVPPDRFIPLAEQTGLVNRLTWHILARALAAFRPWWAEHPGITLAVNLSPVSLADVSLPERILALLSRRMSHRAASCWRSPRAR